MASEKRSGGVRRGAMAQEECLYRCTNLIDAIPMDFYPLLVQKGLYTEQAYIIKDKDCNLIDEPRIIDCVIIPAINLNKYKYSAVEYNEITANKIYMMLKLAQDKGIDNIILGAWGCGVYGNDPRIMANAFGIVIQQYKFQFKKIIFAIINDRNSVSNNYEIFNEILGSEKNI